MLLSPNEGETAVKRFKYIPFHLICKFALSPNPTTPLLTIFYKK